MEFGIDRLLSGRLKQEIGYKAILLSRLKKGSRIEIFDTAPFFL